MRFLLDECCSSAIAWALEDDGHDVQWVARCGPGISDQDVLREAQAGGRIIITEDLDFGEMVVRRGLRSEGLVIMRLAGLGPDARALRLLAAIRAWGPDLAGHVTVIRDRRLKRRRLG